MREILFRGKAINRGKGYHRTTYKNGDWVYGLIERLYDDDFPNIPATMRNTDGVSDIDIDYATIGQYTGLTDINGKKFFEGDVVAGALIWQEKRKNGLVSFKDGSFGLMWYRGGVEQFDAFTSMCNVEYEIIGNIHDNPDLLKGE